MTIAFITLNAVLAGALVHQLWRGTQTTELIATPAARRTVPALVADSAATATWNGAAIQDRSLFYASRHFYVAPPPMLQALPRPDYRLLGTVVAPGRPTIALLQPQSSGVTRRVKAGDELDGWTVRAVERTRVILLQNGQQCEIANSSRTVGSMLAAPLARPAPVQVVDGARVLGAARPAAAQSTVAMQTQPRLYRPPQNQ